MELPEEQSGQLPAEDQAKLKLWWKGIPWSDDGAQASLDEVPLTLKFLGWLREGYELLWELSHDLRDVLQARVADEVRRCQLKVQSNTKDQSPRAKRWHETDEYLILRRLDCLFPSEE